MPLPNSVLIGVTKCGTSSLYHWLADHPEVCAARVKETRYLLDRDYPLFDPKTNYHDHGLKGYEAFFTDCTGDERVIFEATPSYFHQRTALDVLSSMRPRPLPILMLRQPADRIYSMFQYAKHNMALIAPTVSFSDYVHSVLEHGGEGFEGMPIMRSAVEYGRYADHLPGWLDAFGREGLHIILFERLRARPAEVMKELAVRLSIAPEFYDTYSFEAQNITYQVKYAYLHKYIGRPLGEMLAHIIERGPFRNHIKDMYYRLTGQDLGKGGKTAGPGGGRPVDDIEALLMLDAYYAPHITELARLTGLDLSVWDKPRAGARPPKDSEKGR